MKTLKKLFTLLIAMAMTMGMSLTVFAEDTQNGTGTITVNNTSETVGIYVQDNEGTFKLDAATGTHVLIEEGETVAAENRYSYTADAANTYTAYRIFQASPANDGDDKEKPTTTWGGENGNSVSYTATAAQVTALVAPGTALPTTVGGTVNGAGGCFTFTLTANGDYLVTLVEGKKAADVAAYFNANFNTLKTNSTAFPSYPMAVTDGKATATVPFGYYFVTSTNGSVVSVDTTNNNVVINDKNTYADPFNPGNDDDPSNDDLKNITQINGQDITVNHDNTSASIGDILTFEIKNNTSNFVVKDDTSKKVSFIYVNDTIGKGLKYVENATYPFTVTVKNPSEDTAKTLAKNTSSFATQNPEALKYYIVEKAEATGDEYDGDAFTVIIPWLDANGDPVFEENAVVTVTYSAQLDEFVEEVAGQTPGDNASNKADVKYDLVDPDGKPEEPPTDPTPGQGGTETGVKEDTIKVFVYAIAIQKYDGKDNSALSGAHFEVKLGDTVIGAVPETVDGKVTRYMYDSTNTSDTANYTTDFVTNADGQIIIYGVKEGTYTVTETVAPGGYNLMSVSTDIAATVAGTNETTQTITVTTTYKQDNNGIYKKVVTGEEPNQTVTFVLIDEGEEVPENERYSKTDETENVETGTTEFTASENVRYAAIENNAGTELPSTGGIGTTLFYTIGTILVLGAGILLITKKRLDA